MVLMIDNYDSFTWNLVQYLRELGASTQVVRNDALTLDEIEALAPAQVVISPGPCTPAEAGISVALIQALPLDRPLLGVCLGHQSIGAAFGAKIVRANRPMHGKTSSVEHDGKGVFAGIPSPFTVNRYHSLVIEEASLPDCLQVSARAADGAIMGVRHRHRPIEGVQFHPESVLTEHGHQLLGNFLALSANTLT